jgi:hypothetical protein
MNPIFKILSIIGIGFLMYLSFVFGQIQLMEGKHIIYPYLDTKFANDYTPKKFDEIKIGMSLEEVKEIIGEPLYVGSGYKDSRNLNLHYTGDGKLLSKSKSTNKYSDLAWYCSSLEINEEKKVVSIEKGWAYD